MFPNIFFYYSLLKKSSTICLKPSSVLWRGCQSKSLEFFSISTSRDSSNFVATLLLPITNKRVPKIKLGKGMNNGIFEFKNIESFSINSEIEIGV